MEGREMALYNGFLVTTNGGGNLLADGSGAGRGYCGKLGMGVRKHLWRQSQSGPAGRGGSGSDDLKETLEIPPRH